MSWLLSQSLGSSTNRANISVFFNLQNLHFMMEMGGCKCKIHDYKICFYAHSSKSSKTKLFKQFLIHFESWLYFHLIDQLFRVVFLIQLSCSNSAIRNGVKSPEVQVNLSTILASGSTWCLGLVLKMLHEADTSYDKDGWKCRI